jgi:hypothetical protein
VIIIRELEAWLLADNEALAQVLREYSGRRGSEIRIPEINEPLEEILDPKTKLQRILSDAKVAYTKEVARKIAATANLERIASRCLSFREFCFREEGTRRSQ